jgi:ABC-2 type transport system ATP-binding protein
VTHAVETTGLSKRYRRSWALRDCTLAVPEGRVAALVGPNGAGKTTLLRLAAGLLRPTGGDVRVFGMPASGEGDALARVGFVAQDTPLYPDLTVADHLEIGRRLNGPTWDTEAATRRLHRLSIPIDRRGHELSGGQRAQVALTLATSKRPDLLMLDEPVASLDPLARRGFLAELMGEVAERGLTVVLSSHLIADLEHRCDYLIVLSQARVQVLGDVDELLATHLGLTGPVSAPVPAGFEVVGDRRGERQRTLIARGSSSVPDAWERFPVTLEELVLAYLGAPEAGTLTGPEGSV